MNRSRKGRVIGFTLINIVLLFVVGALFAEESAVPPHPNENSATPTYTPIPTATPIILGIDYGDLPESYGTGKDAPSHIIFEDDSQVVLGASVTVEESGLPTNSDADDGIDETITTTHTVLFNHGDHTETFFHIRVTFTELGWEPYQSSYYNLKLGVWVDWDHNGTFSEDEFHRHRGYHSYYHPSSVLIVAPLDYVPDEQLAVRLRLFVDEIPGGTLDWTDYGGQAVNGEVEDYIFSGIPFDMTVHPMSTPTPRPPLPPIPADPFTISGRVWHDFDVRDEPTAADDLLAGVTLKLLTAGGDIQDGDTTLLSIPDESPFRFDEDGQIVDQSGNRIDVRGNICNDEGEPINNIFAPALTISDTLIIDESRPTYSIAPSGLVLKPRSDSTVVLGSLFDGGYSLVAETATNLDGVYRFDNVPIGQHIVHIDRATVPEHKWLGLSGWVPSPCSDRTYYISDLIELFHTVTITETGFGHNDINFSDAAADYGDIPDTYSTTGNNSPAHILVTDGTQIMLGNDITTERDGQPTFDGNGDRDEGVIVPYGFTAGSTQTFAVEVTGDVPAEGAILGVWVDWNHDGTFTEAEFVQFGVIEGQMIIPVTAPDDYEPQALAVRFRLFAGDNLPGGSVDWTDYEGVAVNGEVEDYVLFSTGSVGLQNASSSADLSILPILASIISLLLMQGVMWRVYTKKAIIP